MSKKENKSNLIFEKSLELFSSKGFHATSMRDIANSAEISLALSYNYFKSKEEILVAIFNKAIEQIKASLDILKSDKNPKEILDDYIQNISSTIKENRQLWILVHSLRTNSQIQVDLKKEFEELNHEILATLTYILSKINQNYNLNDTLLFFASIDGIVAMYLINEQFPIDDVLLKLITNFLK